MFWNEGLFDKFVQLIKIDIAEYWRDNAPLRGSTQRWAVAALFTISRLEQVFDESEETIVFDFLSKNLHEHVMIDMIKTSSNISFNEPLGALPGPINGGECAVTSTLWPETMTAGGKLRFVKCLKDEPDDFLNQLICPRRYP